MTALKCKAGSHEFAGARDSLLTHCDGGRLPRYYQLSEAAIRQMRMFRDAFLSVALSEYVWRYDGQETTEDWRGNAGASVPGTRRRISSEVIPQDDASIDSNAMVAFRADHCTLYLFPDDCFVRTASGCRSIGKTLNAEVKSSSFREEDAMPRDSELMGFTWRYINKDGRPDLRFSNNPRIPIYKYGEIVLTSSDGFRLHLVVSRAETAFRFAELLNAGKKSQTATDPEGPPSDAESSAEACGGTPTVDKALRFLGLKPGASFEDASAAYHRLAKQNHPDRVADLAPEFRELAEARMRDLNAAIRAVREGFRSCQDHSETATA